MKKFLIAGIAVLALLAVPMIRTADLMPPELASGFTPEQAERGRALMDALARTHGREAMESHQVLTLSLADEWFGLMGKGSNPFPVARQTFDVVLGTREWSGRFEMTNGPDDGVEWGMQNGRTYRRPPDGAFESPPAKELDSTLTASCMFPTLRYF